MKLLSLFFLLLLSSQVFSQDLLKERIRKLTLNKSSVYVEKGIFHNGAVKGESILKSIRQSYNPKLGYERIVIDFSTDQIPKIYGYVTSSENRLYLDLFETNLAKEFKSFTSTKLIEKINFFPIDQNHISVDFRLKGKVIADVFYLENPGRLVIDLKNY